MKISFYSNDPGNWKFLIGIIERLEKDGITCQIHMNWEYDDEADVLWFDFCNSNLIAASNEDKEYLKKKKVIARIHAAEIYLDFHHQIDWTTVDDLIFVSDHIRRLAGDLPTRTHVIHNGIDLSKFTYKQRAKGFNIGYAGNIVPTKGILTMFHYFKYLLNIDSRYKLKMVGLNRFHGREGEYYNHYKSMLGDRVEEYDEINNINEWLEDIDYLWQPSLAESFSLIVGEAMSKGIKPIINNFYGSEELWPNDCIYSDFDKFMKIITGDYESERYRKFVEKYSLDNQLTKINAIIRS